MLGFRVGSISSANWHQHDIPQVSALSHLRFNILMEGLTEVHYDYGVRLLIYTLAILVSPLLALTL